MVIDTSALVAILMNEPTSERLVVAIGQAPRRLISAGTVVEASLVLLGRFGAPGEAHLDALLRAIGAEVVAVDAEQVALARDAARTFGRGRHPAGLNFGDCFGYALSASHGEPLLFVGEDFAQTDVSAAAW
jgi:ribonuclease VapC